MGLKVQAIVQLPDAQGECWWRGWGVREERAEPFSLKSIEPEGIKGRARQGCGFFFRVHDVTEA
ncbi:MAG: hypothetical protein IIC27_05140 [Chloroflexi bacterium]|nr:hypothetical protein [Chloroflexota bacterium]